MFLQQSTAADYKGGRVTKKKSSPNWRTLFSCSEASLLFSVDNGFVNGVPASGVDTPVVGGVLVHIDSHFSSLDFFVSVDAHSSMFLSFNFLIVNQSYAFIIND